MARCISVQYLFSRLSPQTIFHMRVVRFASLLFSLLAALLCSCATSSKVQGPFQSWTIGENNKPLDLYVTPVAGSPFGYSNFGRANISINDKGFVQIQIPIRNHSSSRRVARVRWEWASAEGMTPGSPAGRALRQINIAGGDQTILRSTSSIPNPGVVMLTIQP